MGINGPSETSMSSSLNTVNSIMEFRDMIKMSNIAFVEMRLYYNKVQK